MGNICQKLRKIKGVNDVFFNPPDSITIFYNSNLEKIKIKTADYLNTNALTKAIEKIKFYSI